MIRQIISSFAAQVVLAFFALVLIAVILPVLGPVPSRAACDMRWPADPGTPCGQQTQSPAQGSTVGSLTPNFHWDYGGYRPEDNGQCIQPLGCGSYSASVYLWEGSESGPLIGRCNTATQSTPVKDCAFSGFGIGPLKPDTTYIWRVTPYFDNIVHAEQSWNYNFRTPPAATPKHKTCQNNACVLIDGAGQDTCSQDADCVPVTHKECRSNACAVVTGTGANSCNVDSDCVPQTHRECRSNACVVVSGSGSNQCNVDGDCTVAQHNECRNNACVNVSGPGASSCSSNADCAPAIQSVVCDSLSVSPQTGNKQLTVNAVLSGHTVNGGSISTYRFSFGDGTSDVEQSGQTLSHTFVNVGTYLINGYVKDNLGNQTGATVNCQKVVTVFQPQVLGVTVPPIIPKSGAETTVLFSLLGSGAAGWLLRKFGLGGK